MTDGKWVSYLRVSTDRQGRSGLGLEAQRASVAAFLNGGRWELVEEFVEVESGRKNDRAALEKAIAACRLYGAKLAIAKLDRLSRDAHFLLSLSKAGIEFVAADMPHANKLTVGIMAMVAEQEAEMISARTKAALAAAKARGTVLGGRRVRADGSPVTLTTEARKAGRTVQAEKADELAKRVAPKIAELKAAGATSLRDIATGLNRAGVKTARGGAWSSTHVSRLMARLGA
jgi:DNA invertase Pin-like site-specific DNA recombinase